MQKFEWIITGPIFQIIVSQNVETQFEFPGKIITLKSKTTFFRLTMDRICYENVRSMAFLNYGKLGFIQSHPVPSF